MFDWKTDSTFGKVKILRPPGSGRCLVFRLSPLHPIVRWYPKQLHEARFCTWAGFVVWPLLPLQRQSQLHKVLFWYVPETSTDKSPYEILLLCSFPGSPLTYESIQSCDHTHLLETPWGATGICSRWHPWQSVCWGHTFLGSRDNPSYPKHHQTLWIDNSDSPHQNKGGN